MPIHHYILNDNGLPVPEPDAAKWVRWMAENAEKKTRVDRTLVPGGVVSTVFLGADQNSYPRGRPLLYETMYLAQTDHRSPEADFPYSTVTRTSTYMEARAEHDHMVSLVQSWAGGVSRLADLVRRYQSPARLTLPEVVAKPQRRGFLLDE